MQGNGSCLLGPVPPILLGKNDTSFCLFLVSLASHVHTRKGFTVFLDWAVLTHHYVSTAQFRKNVHSLPLLEEVEEPNMRSPACLEDYRKKM